MADEADSLNSVKTILSTNWNSANTDSITPTFYISTEQPGRLDYATGNTYVLVYLASHTIDPNDLGASHKVRTVDRVSMDIRTMKSRAHLRKCYNEIRRIFASKVNLPDASFQQWLDIGFVDYSTIGFFRYVYDCKLSNWVVSR